MESKFKEIDWATTEDFKNPFARAVATQPETSSRLGLGRELSTLCGLARRMTMTRRDILYYIIFDEEGHFEISDLRCVVIGRDKDKSEREIGENSQKYHVLIIRQARSALGIDIYERVGVASLRPLHVESEGAWVTIM